MTESPPFLVLDTSIVAKWFIDEPRTEASLAVRNGIVRGTWRAAAPSFMRCELAHVFWKNRKSGYGLEKAVQAFRELDRLGLYEISLVSLLSAALEASYKYDITIYDALYVSLAEALGGFFATCDLKLAGKIKGRSKARLLDI